MLLWKALWNYNLTVVLSVNQKSCYWARNQCETNMYFLTYCNEWLPASCLMGQPLELPLGRILWMYIKNVSVKFLTHRSYVGDIRNAPDKKGLVRGGHPALTLGSLGVAGCLWAIGYKPFAIGLHALSWLRCWNINHINNWQKGKIQPLDGQILRSPGVSV